MINGRNHNASNNSKAISADTNNTNESVKEVREKGKREREMAK